MLRSGVAVHQRPGAAVFTSGNFGGNYSDTEPEMVYISIVYEASSVVPITTNNRNAFLVDKLKRLF